MILFLLAAGLILVYGTVYALFCVKKGGIAAALSVFTCVLVDACLVGLLLYYRINT